MRKYIATFDLHFGYERKNGHKVPLHDMKAFEAVLAFAQDFKPDVWIHGGDMLDCGVISHHNKKKPGNTEGLRLLSDAKEGRDSFITPVESLAKDLVYFTGNHEDWLNDLVIEIPALEGMLEVKSLLKLDRWKVIPQGKMYNLGHLHFVHGDQLKGGEHIAKAAVISMEESIRFGHHHTHQVYTKTSPVDKKLAKTGVAVPCLCTKDPKYGESAPNRWVQGFNFGYVDHSGTFNDYVAIIIDGKFMWNGKVYRG